MKAVIDTIINKMCEFGNVIRTDELNWNLNAEWTEEQEKEFKKWLNNYLKSLKQKELIEITPYPSLIKNSSKHRIKFINGFVFNYGFKIAESDLN